MNNSGENPMTDETKDALAKMAASIEALTAALALATRHKPAPVQASWLQPSSAIRPPQPVTIEGVDYPSRAAAKRTLKICDDTLNEVLASGHFEGTKAKRMRVTIDGTQYVSRTEAMKTLRISHQTLLDAIDAGGTLAGIKRHNQRYVTFGGMTYPTMGAAATAIGMTETELRALRKLRMVEVYLSGLRDDE
jgi:hypothetical protein